MAELSLQQIAEICGAKTHLSTPDEGVSRILLDSRQFSSPDGVLFFALRGHNRNGEQFVPELIQKGVRNFVVQQLPEDLPEGLNFLQVTKPLSALQRIARHLRKQSSARVIGITGSNGKTVVKEWLGRVLQQQYQVCRSPKSYNSQIGVPLSIWELKPDDDFGVFEAGISQPGEMARLEEILKPEWGVFTNIGSAHGENFETRQQKISEKLLLFKGCKKLVYRNAGDFLAEEIRAFAHEHQLELCSWSAGGGEADLELLSRDREAEGSRLKLSFKGQPLEIWIPFVDDASLENVMHVIRTALETEMSWDAICQAVSGLTPVEMRLQMKRGGRGNLIIDDAYNSDLESLRIALHFLDTHGGKKGKILVLSDLLQTGLPGEELYGKVSEILSRFELEAVYAVGPELSKHRLKPSCPVSYYSSTEDLLARLSELHWHNKAILLKAARNFRFERISSRLEQKSHETCLNIYLDRMVQNLRFFRQKLDSKTKVMAMVKAFSYGAGSGEIARLLQFHGVEYLGVAYPDEGVALRKVGVELPILVLNPEVAALEDCVKYNLEPEIYSLVRLNQFKAVVQQSAADRPFPIHLKLETGMNRLGFTIEQLPEVLQALQESPELKVASVFSHMPVSDDLTESEFNRAQIKRFRQMADSVEAGLAYPFMRHLANSSAILNYPESHFDMVRLGISLYGVSSHPEAQQHLQVVSELKAEVSQLKDLKAGDTVSYGRHYRAGKDERIAIVSIGYADGFRRSLSQGIGEVAIRGKRYPVVGNVCMDMIMVLVSGSTVAEGDEVEIFGPHISIYELAEKMGTIPYEVLTGISQRVKRVYFME